MKVLICGSRDFYEAVYIKKLIYSLPQDAIIIHGNAHGADTIANRYAFARKMEIRRYPADWNTYGKAAGAIRNKQMLDEEKPDIIYAFFAHNRASPGTSNMIMHAKRQGIKVIEHWP